MESQIVCTVEKTELAIKKTASAFTTIIPTITIRLKEMSKLINTSSVRSFETLYHFWILIKIFLQNDEMLFNTLNRFFFKVLKYR